MEELSLEEGLTNIVSGIISTLNNGEISRIRVLNINCVHLVKVFKEGVLCESKVAEKLLVPGEVLVLQFKSVLPLCVL